MIKQVHFGEVDGHPAVFFWEIMTGGEEYYVPWPGTPEYGEPPEYMQPYTNIKGYYMVEVYVDGGLGPGKDYNYFSWSIPPDAWGIPDMTGEMLAQQWYNDAISGDFTMFARNDLINGDILVK